MQSSDLKMQIFWVDKANRKVNPQSAMEKQHQFFIFQSQQLCCFLDYPEDLPRSGSQLQNHHLNLTLLRDNFLWWNRVFPSPSTGEEKSEIPHHDSRRTVSQRFAVKTEQMILVLRSFPHVLQKKMFWQPSTGSPWESQSALEGKIQCFPISFNWSQERHCLLKV